MKNPMKSIFSTVALALLALSTLNLQLSTAFAQSYAIDWFTMDGGGGTSTGGEYSVSGIPHCGTSRTRVQP